MEENRQPAVNLLDALRIAEKIKCQTDREQTVRTVLSTVKLLIEYLERGKKKDGTGCD